MRKAMHVFGILTDSDVDWLARVANRVQLSTGDFLLQEGVASQKLFLLLHGKLDILIGQGRSTVLDTLNAGEFIGEVPFIDGSIPTESVKAVQSSELLSIPFGVLQERLNADSGFSSRFYLAMARLLAHRLAVETQRFGSGRQAPPTDPDELDEDGMDEISMGTLRMQRLLHRLGNSHTPQHNGARS